MALLRPILATLCLLAPASAQEVQRFRQFFAGQELGGVTITTTRTPEGERVESREWVKLARQGVEIAQEQEQTALKAPDGALRFTWRMRLSAEPFEGEATWSPLAPRVLRLAPKGLSARELQVPEGAVLWPPDVEARLKEAARHRRSISVVSFSFPLQQWSRQEHHVVRAEPLPGYPDAVRYSGVDEQGGTRMEVDTWISPGAGELRHAGTLAGLPIVTQREDLPPPPATPAGKGFFESTLKTLQPHPFLPWLTTLTVRWTGAVPPSLPADPQQRQEGPRLHLSRALSPSREEAAQPPVKGTPDPRDVPFLAATPLVQHQDPAFAGLLARLRHGSGASRWELSRQVTAFVHDWVEQKDFSVGFASALEVARNPRGDCTEHGVLAVALLRRLGVPARGVVGWVALERTLLLHFWVEVRLGDRWVPMDPTFGQAPASAFRLKLGTTDLADLGSLGWEGAEQAFAAGSWQPEAPWAEALTVRGDRVTLPAGPTLTLASEAFRLNQGSLTIRQGWSVRGSFRPSEAEARLAKPLALPGRRGLWFREGPALLLDLGQDRWLRIDGPDEAEAVKLLEGASLTE